MTHNIRIACPDCEHGFEELSRRQFVQTLGGAAALAGAASLWKPSAASAAPTPNSGAETAVKRFYDTLSETQKQEICFPYVHKHRSMVSANWHVTKPEIEGDFYTDAQRELIREIFRGVTSEDGYERFLKQMEDDSAGFGRYSVAVFGEPATGEFEWMLTGRHLTVRADGDSAPGAAFGGPIVYGHGETGNSKGNLFFYQSRKANDVFEALDPKQREAALLEKAPRENDVPLQGKDGKFPGVAVGELSADQKGLVEEVVKIMLAPYREEDVDEALATLKSGGGFDQLHMAFYKQGDLGEDRVWDIWRVEGPSFVWHFRGAPHVHTYINIGVKS
ncbi:MAG: DUF3500 domain-containing protein [Planctomycetes bacterium]|nr:DUF3500 domain-containing protein [Planctomycetota bacterium]